MYHSHAPKKVGKRRAGPYKIYLDCNAIDCEIPRTTAYHRRKQAEVADQIQLQSVISGHIQGSSTSYQDNDTENILHPTDERVNVVTSGTLGSEDIEGETYSMFENRCPCASSPMENFEDDDSHSQCNSSPMENFEDDDNHSQCNSSPMESFEDDDNHSQCNEEMNDNNLDDEAQKRYFLESLCQCTSTNRGEALMAVMTLGIRHSLTWIGIVDTLKTINALFGNDVVPATKYKIFQYFTTETGYFSYHIICPQCDSLLGKKSEISKNELMMCQCSHEVRVADMESFFLSASFDKQLKTILNKPEVSQNINYRHTRQKFQEGDLTDIYDGNIYKDLSADGKPLSSEYNLSYTFNTDGCQAGNSSTTSLWPIYATINELPPHLRSKNMILVGIWACQRKPQMASFLQPFVEDAKKLSSNGITWELDGTGIVTSKIFAVCSSVDSVARSAMLNMKQFNGYYGCTMCEHPGELVEDKSGRKSIKYTVCTQVPPDRTHDSIVNNMKLAYDITRETRKRMSLKGIFGPSPLMNLMCFDLANGLPPDNMHLLSGVSKQYTNMLLTDNGNDYYVGAPNVFEVIDERLIALRPPTCITRTPRSLKDRALWKASEWRSWLTFYALVCLRGILPQKYLTHLAMLVTAIRILLDERIPRDRLQYAQELLIKFVVLFQVYFGKNAMTYNVHLLLHVCRGVENFGPLWTHNAYRFENENRYLLQLKKSPTHLALQICRRFVMYKTVSVFSDNFKISDRIKQFCEELSQSRLRLTFNTGDYILMGRGKLYSLNAEELACLRAKEFVDCLSYHTIVRNNFRYSSTLHERPKKTDNTAVMTVNGTFALIENICKISKPNETPKVIVFCRNLQVIDSPFLVTKDVSVTHIQKCHEISTAPLHAYSPEFLQVPCILMRTNYGNFVASIPKGCLGD